jgi:hypothetical protein
MNRGHHDKIAAAVTALQDKGLLPPFLNATERNNIIWLELRRQGYPEPMPGRDAIRRFFERQHARQSRQSRVA